MSANAPISTLRLIRWIAWGVIGIIAVLSAYVLLLPEQQKGASIGGPFRMMSMTGAPVDLAVTEKGKPFAVFFGFTNCPDVCPTAMFEIGQVLKKVGDAAKDFHVYFITVDPERDTAEQLKLYISAFDPRIIGLIPANEAELQAVAKQYRAFYRKVPTPSGYTMDHTAAIYLYDRTHDLAGTIAPDDNEDARLAKIRRLLAK